MLIAAAIAMADCTKTGELVPHPLEPKAHSEVASAVERCALYDKDFIKSNVISPDFSYI